ncbi:response regulator, partial [Nocardioides sp. P5_C9_2]
GHLCDVIAVTSARDTEVVRRAVTQGVVLYLLKPFSYAMFRSKLEHYAAYRAQLAGIDDDVVQDEVDQVFGALRTRSGAAELPKGLGPETLRQITEALRDPDASEGLSASEVGTVVGASRVTARRYLEHLADQGQVVRSPRYGGGGRPEVAYRWRR